MPCSFHWLMGGACFPSVAWGWDTLPASCSLSLTNAGVNSWYENFEPQMVEIMKLLRMVWSKQWRKELLCPFPGPSFNGARICCAVSFVHQPTCLLQYCTMVGYRAHLHSLQKLPFAYGQCIFSSVFTFCLSFHTVALKLPLILVFMSPYFSFVFSLRLIDIPYLF